MSSHHFVKEGQEPALLIFDPISSQLADPLLEWAPLVLVSDRALDEVLNWGIKIDVVLAEDSQTEIVRKKLLNQGPVEIRSYHQKQSAILNAFDFLIGNKQVGVNVLSTAMDGVFSEAEKSVLHLQVNLFDEKLKWALISTMKFEKWLPAVSTIHIRKSLGSQAIQIEGLRESEGAFESISDGMVSILSDRLFWVGEPHL